MLRSAEATTFAIASCLPKEPAWPPATSLSANCSTILRAVTDGCRCQSSRSQRHVPIADYGWPTLKVSQREVNAQTPQFCSVQILSPQRVSAGTARDI
jgi:hypothetical protein